ncbi:unnamed protein product [Rotaria sp. Silwood2]|nr:unnamed protein product [Rotaria sp. Silwood2]
MSINHDQMTTVTTTVRFYDSTFYSIALTSIIYLIFQIYSINPHKYRLILLLSFLCTCLSCETFFHIFESNTLINLSNLNVTNYFSPIAIHLILLLSVSSFLWNATQCVALASILFSSNSANQKQSPNFILRRWIRHICVDHVFALLIVRLGRLSDIITVTTLSNMASIYIIASWCSQIAVFPCVLCVLHSFFINTIISDDENSQEIYLTTNTDEFNSILHRFKIIKVLGLALFGLKISALSICEILALGLVLTICLSCLVVAPSGRETSRYTRIFDIFIGKIFDENKDKTLIINEQSEIIQKPIISKTDVHNLIHQQETTQSICSTSSTLLLPTIEFKTSDTTTIINYSLLTDEQILSLIKTKKLAVHNLEKYLPSLKAVYIRRLVLNQQIISTKNVSFSLDSLPYEHYDYSLVTNQCCENVVGYVQLPIGYAGPLRVDNKYFYIPMATTEGKYDYFIIWNFVFL